MNLEIRRISENEIPFLEEMLYQAIFIEDGKPKLPESIIKEPHLSKYIIDFGLHQFDVFFVAIVDKKLVGACWGRLFSIKNKGYGFLDANTPELSIAIKNKFRNKGIGTKLTKKLIETYNYLNVKSISLSVDKKNKAFGLYKKLGFAIATETESNVIMQLDLKSKK